MSRKLAPFAIAYDFDGTLAPGNMQEYDFAPAIGMTSDEFWKEVKDLTNNRTRSNRIKCVLATVGARHAVPLRPCPNRMQPNGMPCPNNSQQSPKRREPTDRLPDTFNTVRTTWEKSMTDNGKNHHRRSIRLKGYDYSRSGAYFITICTQQRKCLLGTVVDRGMELNAIGNAVAECWSNIPDHFPHAELDSFVVMPNHVHGIVVIANRGGTAHRGTACRAPTTHAQTCRVRAMERFGHPVIGSIPTIIRSFKSAATKRINELRNTPGEKLWQRNYWDHIVRNDSELRRIQEYVRDNPVRWEMDRLHPNAGVRHAVPLPCGDELWMA